MLYTMLYASECSSFWDENPFNPYAGLELSSTQCWDDRQQAGREPTDAPSGQYGECFPDEAMTRHDQLLMHAAMAKLFIGNHSEPSFSVTPLTSLHRWSTK